MNKIFSLLPFMSLNLSEKNEGKIIKNKKRRLMIMERSLLTVKTTLMICLISIQNDNITILGLNFLFLIFLKFLPLNFKFLII